MPPTLEKLWLPRGHTDNSINPFLMSCLEDTLEKRREEIRQTQAPMPMGTHRSMAFQPAGAVNARDSLQEEDPDEDDDMDAEREEDDDLASDEITDDAEFGTPMADTDAPPPDEHMGDLGEDSDDLDDDDDDLAGYL